jgi:hypothetical protein
VIWTCSTYVPGQIAIVADGWVSAALTAAWMVEKPGWSQLDPVPGTVGSWLFTQYEPAGGGDAEANDGTDNTPIAMSTADAMTAVRLERVKRMYCPLRRCE